MYPYYTVAFIENRCLTNKIPQSPFKKKPPYTKKQNLRGVKHKI